MTNKTTTLLTVVSHGKEKKRFEGRTNNIDERKTTTTTATSITMTITHTHTHRKTRQ